MKTSSTRILWLLSLFVCSGIVCAGPKVIPHPRVGIVAVRNSEFVVVHEFKDPKSIKFIQGVFLHAKKVGDTKTHLTKPTHKIDFSDRWLIDINSGEIRLLSKAHVAVYRIEGADLIEFKKQINNKAEPDGAHAAGEVSRVEGDFKAIRSALQYYRTNAGGYPTTEQGLVALVKKPKLSPRPKRWTMIMTKVPVDPWKREYQYELVDGKIHLWSKGKDVDDPKHDIHSPARKAWTPEVVLMAYFKVLKDGDLEKAKAMTAKFKTLPDEYLNKYTKKYSKLAKDGEMVIKLEPKSMKVIEGCAVVTFKDGDNKHPDYDPAYLVKQNGEWKVLLKFTQWDDRRFTLTDEQKRQFTELKTWFRGEKDRLYGLN